MSEAPLGRIVELLAAHGLAAEKAAARRIQRSGDPADVVAAIAEEVPSETITLTEADVRAALDVDPDGRTAEGVEVEVLADMTGSSSGTGTYADFLAVFRDRFDTLSDILSDRVRARSIASLETTNHRHGIGIIGMVSDIRSTANGHWLLELEDRTGSYNALVHRNNELYDRVHELLLDQVIAVEGTMADDGGLIFVDELYEPDVPLSHSATRASTQIEVVLISDLHVGSEEFAADAWTSFTDWLDGPQARAVEYLLIGGDLVDGVGVYPGQSTDLDIVDVYEQYERVAEHLKDVPGDIELVIIPGNHDAVRLAEPQPALTEDLIDTFDAHDATFISNPGRVKLAGVEALMYHGTSLDDVIAELPADVASYGEPAQAMVQLLKKRHLAPQFGSRTRIAPEESDHLVIDRVPDIFHAGHTHTFGVERYRDVRVINSGCWQHQTPFQRKVDIEPDVGIAVIVDLSTLDVTPRSFT